VRKSILFLASHPMSLQTFMLPHIRRLDAFYDISLMANFEDGTVPAKLGLDIDIESLPIVRKIDGLRDIKALWFLFRFLRKKQFNAIHTITPKAAFIGMLASWAAGVPIRTHSFTGQVWANKKGLKRVVLKFFDKVTSILATDLLIDSPSQKDFLIKEGVVSNLNSDVLGSGSICGVNVDRFSQNERVKSEIRDELGVSTDAIVCLYLGRLNRDKGVLDLARAFAQVSDKHPLAELWVVGPDESDCYSEMQVLLGKAANSVKRIGFTSTPERYMQAADLFCLPSYREGFGSSVIEAAACGVPALASSIYGLTDAVVEGQTGWMHNAGDVQDLAEKLDYLLAAPAELALKGEAAREYVENYFAEEIVTDAMLQFYQKRLS